MNTDDEDDPFEQVAIYRTAFLDLAIKKFKEAGIRFELDISYEDIGRTISSPKGTCSEGPEIAVYVHKDDIEKINAVESLLFP